MKLKISKNLRTVSLRSNFTFFQKNLYYPIENELSILNGSLLNQFQPLV